MSQKRILGPQNNKSIFQSMAMLFEKVANDEMPIEKADALLRITDRAQRSLEMELKRTATQVLAREQGARIRNVELKAFPEEDPKALEEGGE